MPDISNIMLRMRILSLWMTAYGKEFASLGTDPQSQLDDIEEVLENQRSQIAVLHQLARERAIRIEAQKIEIKKLKAELISAAMRLARIKECV